MDTSDSGASNNLADWARTNSIEILDLSYKFCNYQRCNRFSNSEWLYFDDDHLSVHGANLAVSDFDKFLLTD